MLLGKRVRERAVQEGRSPPAWLGCPASAPQCAATTAAFLETNKPDHPFEYNPVVISRGVLYGLHHGNNFCGLGIDEGSGAYSGAGDSSDGVAISPGVLDAMAVPELKQACRGESLQVGDTKAELLKRLKAHMRGLVGASTHADGVPDMSALSMWEHQRRAEEEASKCSRDHRTDQGENRQVSAAAACKAAACKTAVLSHVVGISISGDARRRYSAGACLPWECQWMASFRSCTLLRVMPAVSALDDKVFPQVILVVLLSSAS